MALHWNATGVKNHEALHEDAMEWAVTNSLIWATMAIGINRITEENYIDFFARMSFFYASTSHSSDITVADVKRRIGLSTNASPLTELQFVKSVGMNELRRYRYEANYSINRALQDA